MQHFEDTVLTPVALADHADLLGGQLEELLRIAPNGHMAMWGIVPNSKLVAYGRMQVGDRALFTGQSRGFYTGTIAAIFHNRPLAERLWGFDGQGRTWEHMYALVDDAPVDIGGLQLNRAIGYADNAAIMGFTVLDEQVSQPALELIDRSLAAGQVPPLVINPQRGRRQGRPTLGELTSADAVIAAIAEYDTLGQQAFLDKYGFGPARTFMLVWEGREYDSKAIAGAALAHQPGVQQPLTAAEFSGGEAGAVARLRALGFTVRGKDAAVPARMVSPQSLRAAMAQWDELGREEFLRRYGATGAARYFVVEQGRSYDAKPLVQAAYAIEHPDQPPLAAGDFRGDRRTIADPLRDLGFWVETDPGEPVDPDEPAELESPLGTDPQRYIDAAARVMGPLDRVVVSTVRREQKLLKGALGLFPGRTATCGLCGRELPTDLLVAAHIKKRSHCTAAEQVDVGHVGMPACKLGCDALFEDGYITVSDTGRIQLSPRASSVQTVAEAAGPLDGRIAPGWSQTREPYFAWHRSFHGQLRNSPS